MKIRKMETRSAYRKRFRQNVPSRKGIANIPSSWFTYEHMTIGKDNEMDIQELSRLRNMSLKTVNTDNVNVNLVEGWTRLFESQGMSHDEAEKQAHITIAQDQNNTGNLVESLKKAGFTEDQVKYFLEGRGGSDDLMESYLAAKKKNLLESGK